MSYTTDTAQKTYESRSLGLSLFLHVSVIGFYLFFMHQRPLVVIPRKMTVLEISNIERIVPKVAEPLPSVDKEVKKVESIKPIVKAKPLPKTIVKKEAINSESKQEVVATSVEAVAPQEVAPVTPTPLSAEPYVQTDFEIIRDKVLARLVYPSVARRLGLNGVVLVALVIDPDGKLLSATIQQSSGKEILDNAALEAANKLKSEQLPRPKNTSMVILPIAFKLK